MLAGINDLEISGQHQVADQQYRFILVFLMLILVLY